MRNEQYIWLVWSSAFLMPWLAIYALFPAHRGAMRKTSLFMTPFGLTEPLFVHEYGNPPSLFDLAHCTSFEIERLIFSFTIGGIGAVRYDLITRRRPQIIFGHEPHDPHHRFHMVALALPFALFPALYLFAARTGCKSRRAVPVNSGEWIRGPQRTSGVVLTTSRQGCLQ